MTAPAAERVRPAEIGLPPQVVACLFDLDGVLTRTAAQHFAAWKRMFDSFLRERAAESGDALAPFTQADYDRWVDGRPRYDGVLAFLTSRGITVPFGTPDDDPALDTVCGLGNRKNALVRELIRREGVETYPGSIRYVRAARRAGLRAAVVSSSANCREVLAATQIDGLFDAVVDAGVARREGLLGKPSPETFVAAARKLRADPGSAAVFEDAIAGVQAARAGDFAFVVGVDRGGQAAELRRCGADVVVSDLEELLPR